MNKVGRSFLILLCVLVGISIIWIASSLIGRVKPDAVIPESAVFRMSITNPVRLFDGILSHESLGEIAAVPALASAFPALKSLKESPLYKNRLARIAARGSFELALLPDPSATSTASAAAAQSAPLLAAWDMGLFSPLLRVLPLFSGFVSIPHLYYTQAGKNSRFEYRMENKTLFIGPWHNLMLITDSSDLFESSVNSKRPEEKKDKPFKNIKPSAYEAVLLFSPDFISNLLTGQDTNIAAILKNLEFDSMVEAGLSLSQKKLELRLMAPVSSQQAALGRLLEQRSHAPMVMERLPAATQYATVLSAGTLEELYQAALIFSGPDLSDSLKRADSSSRALLGLTLNDLLFSWSGKEFAVFGMEGRPHPVYAIQIADERKRQPVFDKAFKSIVLNENISLNLDGTRIPRIEVPGFLQSLLRHWNLFLPSPYYTIYKDYLLASESAETLLAALRAIQKNEVLPKTQAWKNIAGGKASSSAFSVYYSLDLSMPFFLRTNTLLSSIMSVYRQGFVRMSFDKGIIDISFALVPGSGGGVTIMNGYPLTIEGNPSNRVYGTGKGENRRIFLVREDSAIAINPADNSIYELSGQGPLWIIPAAGMETKSDAAAWVLSGQGRVTLVNGDMEPAQGFPALTGVRPSAPPAAYGGRLYLCGDDGRVYTIDAQGEQGSWESSFLTALRSPPSFLSVQAKRGGRDYAAVYPKSFFGEIWLLDAEGKALPNWPASLSDALPGGGEQENVNGSSGIGFGSPLLFARDNRVHAAFVTQAGEFFVFDENAAVVPPFPLILDGIFYQQPIFDGDFFWLISSNGTLFQISPAGEILYQNIPGFSVMEEGYITAFDCDGDKVPEIFISGEGNALHGYSRNFRSLEGFPLPVWGKPLFVDPSGNVKAEIIGLGMDRKLYRWQFK